jgi:hypothetical protein
MATNTTKTHSQGRIQSSLRYVNRAYACNEFLTNEI